MDGMWHVSGWRVWPGDKVQLQLSSLCYSGWISLEILIVCSRQPALCLSPPTLTLSGGNNHQLRCFLYLPLCFQIADLRCYFLIFFFPFRHPVFCITRITTLNVPYLLQLSNLWLRHYLQSPKYCPLLGQLCVMSMFSFLAVFSPEVNNWLIFVCWVSKQTLQQTWVLVLPHSPGPWQFYRRPFSWASFPPLFPFWTPARFERLLLPAAQLPSQGFPWSVRCRGPLFLDIPYLPRVEVQNHLIVHPSGNLFWKFVGPFMFLVFCSSRWRALF